MATRPDESLLAKLAAGGKAAVETDPWSTLAASEPDHEEQAPKDERLDALLERINGLASKAGEGKQQPEAGPQAEPPEDDNPFLPVEPQSFHAAQLTETEVESLALKYLLARGGVSGRDIADHVKLPFVLIDQLLRQMKNDRLVVHRADAPMNDYLYELSDLGRERARRYADHCTYFGSAPVALSEYVASVAAQSLTRQHPTADDLRRAFEGLLLSRHMLDRLGPAVNSGRGLFLYGFPGNGKTSIAERITRAFGKYLWIPRSIGVDGEIIRLFDPVNHREAPLEGPAGLWDARKIDKRWVRILRPTIIAGGELTMSALEVTINTSTGISEAPLQLKSNCGTLVIDDFGRQRMPVEELLNRWIVPLETRVDYLNLPNGKKITVPFDQLIVFSTNLEPRELVDEAFLRRIPYKIEVIDPTEEEFRELFRMMTARLGIPYREEAVDYVIERHYKQARRPFRFCQPRDLLLQVKHYCDYRKCDPELTPEHFDLAAENYFAVM